jgi:hypothetical protein
MDEVRAAAVEAARDRRPFAEVLAARPGVRAHLGPGALSALLRPDIRPGSAEAFVDRVLAAHDARAAVPSHQETQR